MAITYTDNGGGAPNGSDLEFTYTFPIIQTEDVKVALNGVTQATTKYAVDNVSNPTKITFNNTSVDSSVQNTSGAPKSGVRVRVYRETTVGKANGDEDPKAVFAAGSSIRAIDLNANQEQSLMAIHELQTRPIETEDIQNDAITGDKIADDQINSEHYVAGSIDHEHLANDIIDGDNIQDDVINSEHYAAGSIDLEHMSANSVDSDQYVDGSIDRVHLEADIIDSTKLADNAVNSEHYVDGSIDHVHLANDIIDGDNIQDDVINSEHYVAGSIDEEHIANSAVTSNKIADNAVTTTEILNGAVTTAKLAADAIDGTKLADNAVDSEHYTDGSIDRVHLEADIIDSTKLADNAVNSEHYVDGSIDHVHLANDIIDGDNIQDDVVNSEHIAAGALDNEHYAAGSITSDKLNGATVVTNSEQAASTPNDTSFFTTAAAEARYFNASTGETIKDGQSFPDNDTTIATTAAINDRIIDLVDDVGGFVPIANETSFPTTNPDINLSGSAKGGTIVSVSAASTNLVPSGTTVTIANGRGSGLAVIITGVSATIPSGFGFLVETTSTDHTYAFHRLVPKATEVTTVAGKATEIGRLGTAAAVEDMSILGTADVVADLNTLGTADVVSDMNALAVSDVISDMNTLAVTSVINDMDTVAGAVTNVNNVGGSIANVNTTAGSIANVNTVAGSISNVNTVGGSISNVNTTAGSISNVNTVASNISSVNSFANTYRIGANNPTTSLDVGDLFFNTTSDSLKVYTGSAWVDGVTATGNFAVVTGNTYTGSNVYNDDVKAIFGTGSDGLEIFHNGSHSRLVDNGTGNIEIASNSGINLFNGDFSETIATFTPNGAITLYHDNTKRIETTASGTTVTGGNLVLESAFPTFTLKDTDHNPDWTFYNGNGTFRINESTNNINYLSIDTQAHFDCDVRIPHDDHKFKVGAGDDLEIYHDGTLSYIKNNTAKLVIRSDTFQFGTADGTHRYIDIPTDEQGVSLFYDDSKKFETTVNGVNLPANSDIRLVNGTWSGEHGGKIQHHSNYLFIQGGSNGLIYRSASGTNQWYIGSNGYLVPNADSTYDIGTNSLRVRNGYFDTLYGDGSNLTGINTDLVADTSPQLGGELQSNGNHIRLSDQKYIYFDPTGTGIAGYSGGVYFEGNSTGKTIYIRPKLNQDSIKALVDGAVELHYDGSKKFETTSTGATITGSLLTTGNLNPSGYIKVLDGSDGIYVGTGNDLQIYHDGSDSVLTSATGSLNFGINNSFNILGGTDLGEYMARFIDNGAVQLYHNGTFKFETNAEGVRVDGILEMLDDKRIQMGDSDDLQIYHSGGDNFINIPYDQELRLVHGSDYLARFIAEGQNRFYYDHSTKAETTSTGFMVNGHLDLVDGNRLRLGSSQDLQIVHDGNHSYIEDTGTGNLVIRTNYLDIQSANGLESLANFAQDGIVRLYENSVVKFQTGSGGDYGSVEAKTGKNGWDGFSIGGYYAFMANNQGNADFCGLYNDLDNEWLFLGQRNGYTQLFYNGSEKLETTSLGAKITGSLEIEGGTVNGNHDATLYVTADNNSDWGLIVDYGTGSSGKSEYGAKIVARTGSTHAFSIAQVSGGAHAEAFLIDGDGNIDKSGHILPRGNNSFDLGSTSYRWQNIYTGDLHLSNKGSSNEVDGSWGDWTIQEGESDLFLKNNRSGKKYKFNLMEVS